MDRRFDYFVVLAEMRTGSNFLEDNINAFPGVKCYGEAFNPYLMGRAGQSEMLGLSMQARDENPLQLLDRMRVETKGLPGFRFFHDHDPRIAEHILPDPRCAKIVLTRNPVDSYVSWKIARQTDQWVLEDLSNHKPGKATFDAAEFEGVMARMQGFQLHVLNTLQRTGQTAFYIGYDDLRDLEVINGMAAWLGVDHRLTAFASNKKVQNPRALEDKVANFGEMENYLSGMDRFDLSRTPNFEPRRPPAVPTYVAGVKTPLLYMPVRGGPERRVTKWLASLDGVDPSELQDGFNQKSLRQWKRQRPGHRSFTVLRHPVPRLHRVFVERILLPGPDCFWEIREVMRKTYDLPIPDGAPGKSWDTKAHNAAFTSFARIVKGILSGQTNLRVDPAWASQSEILTGFAQFALPDVVLREAEIDTKLPDLANEVGAKPARLSVETDKSPIPLAQVYDAKIEKAVRDAYRKDYITFGFRDWSEESAGA